MRLLIITLLSILATPIWAASPDDRLLERAEIRREAGRIEIEVSFTRSLRYVTHTPADYGEYIKIQLSPLSRVTSDDQGLDGRNTIRWSATADVPLDEISTETATDADPFVIVRFRQPVKFSVKPGNQLRSIVITLPAAVKPTDEKVRAPTLPGGSGEYVINLLSQIKPFGDDIPSHPEFEGRQLYVVRTMVKGRETYRLRLGFFDSFSQAEQLRKELTDQFTTAWLSQVTDRERKASSEGYVDLLDIKTESVDRERPLPPITLQRLIDLMEQARRSIAEGDNSRAIAIYEKVMEYPVQPFQKDAQEYLGLARERKGQLAQAKAVYENYLAKHPKGRAAERVRQRLAGLVTASITKREKLREAKRIDEPEPWEVYGSLALAYRRDISTTDSTGAEVTQSNFTTDLDINGRRRTGEYDLRTRATGGYTHDFLDSEDHALKFSSLYFDMTTNDGTHTGRIGRQSRTSGGVLGRFDGFFYGHRFSDLYRLNLVSGAMVESTEDGLLESDRYFNGASIDLNQPWKNWDINLFFIEQRVDGEIDRRAIGSEIRYFENGDSLFALLDYDISYDTLNIAYALGNIALSDETTLNMILDYRKSPILTTSNALQGQGVTSISALKGSFTIDQIRQLAADRTATSRSATLGVSHRLASDWQISTDITVSNLSGTPASGGVDASPATGDEYFMNLQFIGSNLFLEGDLVIPGFRYSNTSTAETLSASLNVRYPIGNQWRVNPRLRLDYRERTDGTTQWILAPNIRTTYRWKKHISFEFEGGGEWSEENLSATTQRSSLLFLYLGYRWDF
ncbi:MAG: tetratricopeptide repeat protein [Sedimenticola sp.]